MKVQSLLVMVQSLLLFESVAKLRFHFLMATVRSFEDLTIWKMSRSFSQKVFRITCTGEFASDFSLRNQINGSSGSVMDNISEGFERGGNREFITFLSYAKGSIGESRSQLFRAFDRKYIDESVLTELRAEAIEIGSRIGALMSYLQKSEFKGSKFHEPEIGYEKLENNEEANPDPRNFEP
jgi:four helix bundle protein